MDISNTKDNKIKTLNLWATNAISSEDLYQAINSLGEHDRELIHALFFCDVSEREYGDITGSYQGVGGAVSATLIGRNIGNEDIFSVENAPTAVLSLVVGRKTKIVIL